MAWAGLQYPLDLITEPVSSTQLTNPPGIDEELGALVGGKFSRGMSTEAGYNPKADFREWFFYRLPHSPCSFPVSLRN